MADLPLLPLIMRWLHILAAITAIGGAIFVRMALMPAAKAVLDDDTHKRLREAIIGRWMMIVHSAVALLLISGFYNYLVVTRHLHPSATEGQGVYHMLFGIKFMLALVVMGLAILLSTKSPGLAAFRAQSRLWLTIAVVLGIAVVLIAGVMQTIPRVIVP